MKGGGAAKVTRDPEFHGALSFDACFQLDVTEEALQVRPLFSSESVQFRVMPGGGREARRRHLRRSEDLLLKIVALPH